MASYLGDNYTYVRIRIPTQSNFCYLFPDQKFSMNNISFHDILNMSLKDLINSTSQLDSDHTQLGTSWIDVF